MNHQHHDDRDPIVREESTYLTDERAAAFCSLFADGLDSGMGYTRILDMLERQNFDDHVVTRLRQALQDDGNRLGEAFARFGVLDPTARNLILVAERQGTLPSTFQDLASHYSKRHERRKKFVYGLVEPFILIALGFLVARNIVTGDLNSFLETMDAAEHLKPLATQAAIEVALFALTVGFCSFVFLKLPVDMPLRDTLHRLWLRLPLAMFNRPGRTHSIALFFRYVRKSLSSGLTVLQGLDLAADASNNPSIEAALPHAKSAIEDGKTLATALQHIEALPRDSIDFVDVGEESGHLEERLEELADRYEEKAEESFEVNRRTLLYVLRLAVVVGVIGMLLFMVAGTFVEQFSTV